MSKYSRIYTNFEENEQQTREKVSYTWIHARIYVRETRAILPDEYLTLSTLNT